MAHSAIPVRDVNYQSRRAARARCQRARRTKLSCRENGGSLRSSSGSAACTACRAVNTTAISSLSRSFCGVHRHAWHPLVHIALSISDPIFPKRVCLAHIRIGDIFCLRLGAYARTVILLRIADDQSSLDRHNLRRMARRPAATDTLDLYVGHGFVHQARRQI
jgi:hypothetical protein